MSKRKQKVQPYSQPGAVALTKKNKCLDGTYVDHKKYIKLYRHHTMRVVRDVRKGVVNEVDIDILQNFIQFSLALMDRAPMEDIDKAWRNAEAMSFIHADMGVEIVEQEDESKDYEGVLDPVVQSQATEGAKESGSTIVP